MSKILILDLSHRYGGASERAITLLRCFRPEQAVLGCLHGAPVAKRAQMLGLNVRCVGKHKLDPRIFTNLRRLIREDQVVLVDSQNPQSRLWASLLASKTGIRHVATLNSWPGKEYGKSFKGRLYRFLDSIAARNTHFSIAVSKEIEQALYAAGCASEQVQMVENAVAVVLPGDTQGEFCAQIMQDVPPGSAVCCAVGRLTEVKGFEYLISAIDRVRQSGHKLVCLILGEGELRNQLQRRIDTAGLSHSIRLLGNQDHTDVIELVHASDFFVMPSLSEGMPLALMEAASVGKAVVASEVGGIPAIVEHGVSGKLVPAANTHILAEALTWMCDHPQAVVTMGAAGKRSIESQFNIAVMVDAVLACYAKASPLLATESADRPIAEYETDAY